MTSKQVRAVLPQVTWRSFTSLTAVVMNALLPFLSMACRQSPEGDPSEASAPQSVRAVIGVQPKRKTIRREVGQPGLIQAFERTPIVSRIPGYVLRWNVDIGKAVHKDEILAELWVPEMVSELKLKEEQVHQATKLLAMAETQVATAKAQVQEAEAAVSRAEATNDYWKGQSEHFTSLVKEKLLDKQAQSDALNQFRSSTAALSEAKARRGSAIALQQEKESARDKAAVDIRAADADRQRQADLVAYAKLTAPYDGVVTQKTVDTKKFVQPATGGQGDVLYVVERADIVRIFVSVPETDADWVYVGTPATVRIQALQGLEIKGAVTRTAWSLNRTTRTLLTEIDLPNPELPKVGRRLRPGLYAYALVTAEWRDVLTLPASAVVTDGDVNVGFKHFCYLIDAGRVKRTQVEIGAKNENLVEVLKKQVPVSGGGEVRWESFTGTEQVVQSDVSGLKDGQLVNSAKE